MSNEIYPLGEYTSDSVGKTFKKRRSVNQRLAPIFAALLNDPDGWCFEYRHEAVDWPDGGNWVSCIEFTLPTTHEQCDNTRLVPKRKTIPVEIPVPDLGMDIKTYPDGSATLIIPFKKHSEAAASKEAIRSAMEGK